MSTTAETILTRAYGYSLRNRQGAVANEATELVSVINRLTIEAFLLAARINPTYFGLVDEVAYTGSPINGWPRPSRALSVYRIEATGATVPTLTDGRAIWPVPDDDRGAVTLEPSIVERGTVFVYNSSGIAGSPTSGTLRFHYSRAPVLMTPGGLLSQTIDSSFPDHMTGMIEAGVAHYLAVKDGRADEIPAVAKSVELWQAAWTDFLLNASPNTIRRFAPRGGRTPETGTS